VQWNGATRSTTYVSDAYLLAGITAADVASAGTASVTVVTPQAAYGLGTSTAATFTIAPATPVLQVKTSTLTLGPVLAGGSATGTITVLSAGQAALTLSSATLSAGASGFTVTNNCAGNVAPGQTCTISVAWAPTGAAGTYQQPATLSLTSNGGNATVSLNGLTGNLNMTADETSVGVKQGGSATVTLGAISYGYIAPSTLTLSCSGLPDSSSCSFSPASWSLAATAPGSNNSLSSTLTITTTAPTIAARRGGQPRMLLAGCAVLLCLCLRRRRGLVLAVAVALVLGASGCSGAGSGSGTPPGGGGGGTPVGGTPTGSYTVTITATDGTAKVTVPLTLTVN
jgi:hypothetical protein